MSPKRPEKIRGDKTPDAIAQLGLWYPAASYNFTSADSYTAWRNQTEALPKQCYGSNLLDVTGSWTTGSGGEATLLLSEFVCLRGNTPAAPVNVVATPNSATPFFLTIQHSLVATVRDLRETTDVEIKVWTWNFGTSCDDIIETGPRDYG